MTYYIWVDASCDMISNEMPDGIFSMTLSSGMDLLEINGRESLDERQEFYRKLKNQETLPKTSQIPQIQYEEVFKKAAAEGKGLIYLSLSSGLSATYNNACMAINNVKEEFPDAKLAVIDTKFASGCIGILLSKAIEYRRANLSFDECVNNLLEDIKHIKIYFIVEDLDFLRRGGRIPPLLAKVGSALNIKPIISFDEEGRLTNFAKKRGLKQAIKVMMGELKKYNSKDSNILIHFCLTEGVDEFIDIVKEELNNENIVNVCLTPVIGSHTGPCLIGCGFLENYDRK